MAHCVTKMDPGVPQGSLLVPPLLNTFLNNQQMYLTILDMCDSVIKIIIAQCIL